MTNFWRYRKILLLLVLVLLLFTLKKYTTNTDNEEQVDYINEIDQNTESCSDTVNIFSAVAQAKKDLSKIEFVVLNVLDGSNHSNCDCCIYGDDKLSIHRQNAIVKEKYAHNSIFADLIASQYRCFVRNIRFKIKHIQLIGKKEFCNSSDILHPVIYASVKENKIAICAKIAYNYLNPLHLIEWFEYQKMMGVDTVLISLQQVNEDANVVLNHYKREGIAKLISFPSKLPGNIDRGFALDQWHYHQSTHDEQVAVYSCKEILQGFAFVAIVDLDEFIVHENFLVYTEILKTELLPAYPDAAAFTLNVSFFLTDWGISGVEPLMTSRYIKRSKPLFHRFKNIYLPSKIVTVDTHLVWPRKGYRRIVLRSHNIILHHYRECKYSDNTTDICTTFSKNTDNKMMKIMSVLYTKVVAVKRRCGISAG